MGLSWKYDTLCLLKVGCVWYKLEKMSLKFCEAKLVPQNFTIHKQVKIYFVIIFVINPKGFVCQR